MYVAFPQDVVGEVIETISYDDMVRFVAHVFDITVFKNDNLRFSVSAIVNKMTSYHWITEADIEEISVVKMGADQAAVIDAPKVSMVYV